VMNRLSFNGATVCDIDATIPYPQVLAAALEAIREASQVHAPTT
jgi:hypothetical protein